MVRGYNSYSKLLFFWLAGKQFFLLTNTQIFFRRRNLFVFNFLKFDSEKKRRVDKSFRPQMTDSKEGGVSTLSQEVRKLNYEIAYCEVLFARYDMKSMQPNGIGTAMLEFIMTKYGTTNVTEQISLQTAYTRYANAKARLKQIEFDRREEQLLALKYIVAQGDKKELTATINEIVSSDT
jgi:hypothetical protein